MRPVGIDLFAGAGGLSLGFEQAGFEILAAIDNDPIHCATHQFNFPRCNVICESIANLSGDRIREMAGVGSHEIDVVIGGPPCQGFSAIGKNSPDDPRNSMVLQFARLVLELSPSFFVLENVVGLTHTQHRRLLEDVISAFEQGGYQVRRDYRVLNAVDFGVPQNRRRLFLIGAKIGKPLPEYPTAVLERINVADALGDLPNVDEIPELIISDTASVEFGCPTPYSAILRGLLLDPADFSPRRQTNSSIITSSLRTIHGAAVKSRFANTSPGDVEPVSRFYRLELSGVSNTLRAGTGPEHGSFTSARPIHPSSPRCITNREAARLHSYPDWFRFHYTKWHGFRQIGNSVPPKLARAVAAEIAKVLDYQPIQSDDICYVGDPALLRLSSDAAKAQFHSPGICARPVVTA